MVSLRAAVAALGLLALLAASLGGAAPAARGAGAAASERAPGLFGPAPYKCGGGGCWGDAPGALSVSRLAGLDISPHVVRTGKKVTGTISMWSDWNTVSGFNWPVSGKVVRGCGKKDLVCVWRPESPSTGWITVTVSIDNNIGYAESEDFYGVVGKDDNVLDGFVRNRTGYGVANVKVAIKGRKGYTTRTNAGGYFNSVLPEGDYVVSLPAEQKRSLPKQLKVRLSGTKTVEFKLKSEKLAFTYEMPQRFGLDQNSDKLVDYFTDPGQISPQSWTLDVKVTREGGQMCHRKDTYEWKIDGAVVTNVQQPKPCLFAVPFPREGVFDVEVTGRTSDGFESYGSGEVTVQDWLVVGLGDSVGSGEGNPDLPKRGNPKQGTEQPVTWQEGRCHRSAHSFEAVAARQVEERDDQTSVTFVHLACSGAGVNEGTVGPYFGIEPGNESLALPSQVSEVQRLVGPREVDAVVVSIGANDIGFGEIVEFCIKNAECMTARYPDPKAVAGPSFDLVVTKRLADLPRRYDVLAERLKTLVGPEPQGRVYIAEYFDPTRAANGRYCDSMVSIGGLLKIDRVEAEWAYERVVKRLNAEVRRAAAKHGWNFVRGIEEGYSEHGYCAGPARWIVTLTQSLSDQGNQSGALHPNQAGHRFGGGRVSQALRADLYKGGKPRKPRKPAQ